MFAMLGKTNEITFKLDHALVKMEVDRESTPARVTIKVLHNDTSEKAVYRAGDFVDLGDGISVGQAGEGECYVVDRERFYLWIGYLPKGKLSHEAIRKKVVVMEYIVACIDADDGVVQDMVDITNDVISGNASFGDLDDEVFH